METHYYFIFAGVIILLQLLIFSLSRTLAWLFQLPKPRQKWLTTAGLLGVNGLIGLHIAGFIVIFRPMAFILVLLTFAFFISILTACLNTFTQYRFNTGLRVLYPIAFLGLVALSVYNAYTPKIVRYSVQLDKPLATPLKIGVASDFHLGKLFGAKQLDQLAAIFQQEKVDLILLPGDIMDDNTTAYVAENMQPHLAKLQAPLGVYATLGNHDFFGHQQAIAEEIQKAGIQLLWDQAVEVDGKFTIIGRNDDLVRHRPTTAQLLQNVDTQKPVFLMDHRPTEMLIHSQLPIDIQVSGHTHNGQIFPANFITKLVYHLAYGYEKIGLGHYFTTSGYGFWGIPMRLGSQSEVLILEVKGQ